MALIDEVKIGVKIHRLSISRQEEGRNLLNEMNVDLKKLHKAVTTKTKRVYDKQFGGLQTNKDNMVLSNQNNLLVLPKVLDGLRKIQVGYRKAYGDIFKRYRRLIFLSMKEREAEIKKQLAKIGIKEKRWNVKEKDLAFLEALTQKGFKQINDVLLKWENFVYDTFYSGVARAKPLLQFRKTFINDDGTIKIGSSLNYTAESLAQINAVEQRTEFNRRQAAEEGYNECFNANPMDMKTKSECIEATLAGVIPEVSMGADYGFPPRFVCRCELVYTRGSWKGVNAGINQSIEERRQELITELWDAPNQKSFWLSKGKIIVPKDIQRAQGKKMYKTVADKIDLLADTTAPLYAEVPLFEKAWVNADDLLTEDEIKAIKKKSKKRSE